MEGHCQGVSFLKFMHMTAATLPGSVVSKIPECECRDTAQGEFSEFDALECSRLLEFQFSEIHSCEFRNTDQE